MPFGSKTILLAYIELQALQLSTKTVYKGTTGKFERKRLVLPCWGSSLRTLSLKSKKDSENKMSRHVFEMIWCLVFDAEWEKCVFVRECMGVRVYTHVSGERAIKRKSVREKKR